VTLLLIKSCGPLNIGPHYLRMHMDIMISVLYAKDVLAKIRSKPPHCNPFLLKSIINNGEWMLLVNFFLIHQVNNNIS